MTIVARRSIWIAALLVGGCGDEVVGYFDASSGGDETTAAVTSSSDTTTSESTTGDGGFIVPGCFRDDFDDDTVDDIWNIWVEEDAALEEIGGGLRMVPPSFGIWDTGIVGAYNYGFPFTNGYVRMRVSEPPDPARTVVLFLTVGEIDGTLLSMQMSAGEIHINESVAMVEKYHEVFPATPYPPWIGIRSEGGQVYFEVSDDGIAYSVLAQHEQLDPFDDARALVMAQTYGTDTDRSAVVVDVLETCVQ